LACTSGDAPGGADFSLRSSVGSWICIPLGRVSALWSLGVAYALPLGADPSRIAGAWGSHRLLRRFLYGVGQDISC
jgi:hypothetical protein